MIETAGNRSRAAEQGANAPNIAQAHGKQSDHLANERTHLAYLRTAISLISLGITVNRFSLYLKQHEGTFHSDKGFVLVLTLSVVVAAAGGILWMFRR